MISWLLRGFIVSCVSIGLIHLTNISKSDYIMRLSIFLFVMNAHMTFLSFFEPIGFRPDSTEIDLVLDELSHAIPINYLMEQEYFYVLSCHDQFMYIDSIELSLANKIVAHKLYYTSDLSFPQHAEFLVKYYLYLGQRYIGTEIQYNIYAQSLFF